MQAGAGTPPASAVRKISPVQWFPAHVELPSDKGHMASHADAAMWAPILAAFMKSL